jgi:hypothetical protein
MALTTIDVHGIILDPVTNDPAEGTVVFKILHELRDNLNDIVYAPATFTATLDINGEFTIALPVTDDANVTPLNWSYWVHVNTDILNSSVFYVQLPASLGPVAEFADLLPIDVNPCTPDGTACAPIGALGALQTEVDDLQVTVGVLQSDLADLDAALTVLEGTVATQGTDIATLQGTVAALSVSVGNIASDLVDAEADIAVLQGQMTTALADITTLQGQVATLQGNAGLVGPTVFVNVTPVHANITLGAVPAATRLDRGGDPARVRGFLVATGAVPASAVLANIATLAHRPQHAVSLGVRYTAGSSRFQVSTGGDMTLGSALALNDQVWLDSTTYDMVA